MAKGQSLIQRVRNKASINPNGCWEWNGCTDNHGYGNINAGIKGKTAKVHRQVFITLVGEVSNHHELHHLCENPSCFNPTHLVPLTIAHHRNISPGGFSGDGVTSCPSGHPYDEANTLYLIRKRNGRLTRQCRACNRERKRAAYWKKREMAFKPIKLSNKDRESIAMLEKQERDIRREIDI